MRATPLMLATAIALGLGMAASDALAASPSQEAVRKADGLNTYIVVFDEPAAARFRGFAATDKTRPRLAASSAAATGKRKFDARSPEAVAYVDYLSDLRRVRLADASRAVGRPLVPMFTYAHAMNGMAIKLSATEAEVLAGMPGVKAVAPEFMRYLQTNIGPTWIKANLVWNGTATGTQNRGEGVVVGVIDTGVNRTHASFSGTGVTNPLGGFRGYCISTPSACNSKLVGLYDFTTATTNGFADPVDTDGHGTHTASTAAGAPFSIYSGVAPRANLIVYKACPGDSCTGSALIASINQAVVDGVDVINYSIGSGPEDPWLAVGVAGTDDAEAFLAAREAGIVAAVSAGNDGPLEGTVGNPSNSPWVMSVAAATHNGGGTGDRLASFSGRGPVVPLGIIKPDVTAPGVGIIAAGLTNSTSTAVLSGTSMSAPHVAGAAALVKAANPSLGPDEIISALTLTARASVTEGGLPTTPHESGGGTVDVSLAVKAGLYLDVPANGFNAPRANPYTGGAQNINLPSLGHGACFRTCVLTRTFKQMPGAPAGANYTVQVSVPAGTTVTPSVTSFNSSAAGQAINFTVNVDSPQAVGQWVYGSVTLVNNAGDGRPNLKLPLAIFATPFSSEAAANALTAVNRTVTRERDFFDLDVSGLVPLPSAQFATTGLVTPTSTTQTITADPTNSDAYDNVNANYIRVLTVPATPAGSQPIRYRVRASTTAASPDIDLFVGRDSNGNSLPSAGEEQCTSLTGGSDELCELTVFSEPSPVQYWVMVQNYSGPGTNVRVDSVAVPLQAVDNRSLVATGPGSVAENAPFKIRVAYDDPSMVNGTQRFGYVFIKAGAGDTAAVLVPVTLTRTGSTFEPFALANGVGREVTLPNGSKHDRLYFDVPPHATSVQFSTSASTGNVDLYVARVASPTGPTIAAAPADANNAALRAFTASGNETFTVSGGSLAPGRWYVVPVNNSGATASATVTATVTAQGARPGFLSGQYVNVARDGHGIFVDFAGPQGAPDQWVTVWYTYLEDNTPTWYYSQGASPTAAGIWKAELFRVTWDGDSTHAVDVGDVIITETGTQSMTFNFNLDGRSGFENMARVGGGSCPSFNGQAFDTSGHWFSPSLSGFGYTYLAAGGSNPQEVFIPYVYDGSGFPRWLYGQKTFDGGNSNFGLQWFSGFSPLAAPVGLTGTAAGTGTRTVATNNVTNMSVSSTFGGALSGNWVQNRAVSQLSQRKNCQ
ncbi:MAG TPA: S8 family serine peptidase [Arenimonas sp.]|nr:S8 family serine peptidase [Arenimonas sp.]